MTQESQPIGPLVLRSSLHETIWGGRHLAEVAGKALPEGALVGESWETAVESVVSNAPYTGLTLGEMTARLGEALIGTRARAVFGDRFPLLAKFLDAHQWLSVQVHPDDAYAAAHEHGKLGKTETWYILHAEPGAQIVYGLAREASRDEVRAAIAQNRLEGLLHMAEVTAGDVIFVPAGTVHAIGGGIVLYELQEYSDVTYRLYDYGRLQANGQPRELHVDASLEVMRYGPATPGVRPVVSPVALAAGWQGRVLVGSRYFVLEELTGAGALAAETLPTSCQILTVLGGSCMLRARDAEYALTLGDTVVLPAALGAYSLDGTEARVLRAYVPDEDDALLRHWRQAQDHAVE
ncbi:MAG: Mannose-6-phosphate isomerase [Ktedonobacterales bacterium]|jgi:mannose-6-phosphate isomerase|nr:MAG: Mannose-6-phosphate isomerase [Ktedonobacterales bacterium]